MSFQTEEYKTGKIVIKSENVYVFPVRYIHAGLILSIMIFGILTVPFISILKMNTTRHGIMILTMIQRIRLI